MSDVDVDTLATEFWRDGAVCVRSYISHQWVEDLRAAVEEEIQSPGPGGRYADADRGTFFASIRPWRWRTTFEEFVRWSEAGRLACRLFGSSEAQLFSDQLFVKKPGAIERTPWHQDMPYWPLRGDEVCSVWVALDTVTLESGGLEYIRGSHSSGAWYRPERFTEKAEMAGNGETYDVMPEFDADELAEFRLSWDLEPGDCVVHHGRTVHGGGGNTVADRWRRGYSTRWMGSGVVYDDAPGRIHPPECHGLQDGQRFPEELFPKVRCAQRPGNGSSV